MSESNIISETLDLKIKKVNAKESKKCLESLEFWTDCILKSLLLEYDLQKKIRSDRAFVEGFKKLTVGLIDLTSSNRVLVVIKKCMSKVVDIIAALYTMIDPDVIENLHKRLTLSKSPKIYELNKELMSLLYNHPICVSVLRKGESKVSNKTVISEISSKHPLANLILEESVKSYIAETDTRDCINILSDLFCLFDHDSSLSVERRKQIANVYFPLIPMVCAHKLTNLANDSTNRNMMTCVLWVTRNCDPALFDAWWSLFKTEEIQNFIAFLLNCNLSFKYIGTDRDEMNHKTCLCREVVSEFNVSTKSQALMMIKDRSIYAGSSESVEEPSCVEKSLSDVKSGGGKEQRLKRVRMMMLNRNKQNATMKLHDFTKNSLKDLIQLEAMMTKVVVRVVFDIFQRFLVHKACAVGVFSDVCEFLLANMEMKLTPELYLDLYELIHYYLVRYGEKILDSFPEKKAERFLCRFFSSTLQYSVQPVIEISSKSCFFIYILTKFDYSNRKTLDLTKRSLVVSLHDKGWIVNLHPLQAKLCSEVVRRTVCYGAVDAFALKAALVPQLEAMNFMINELFAGLIAMASLGSLRENCDCAHYEELIEATAAKYEYIPLIRIGWIKRLARHHESKKNFIEAAECYLHLNEIIDKDLEKIDETDDDFDAKKKEREKKLIYIGKTIENFEKGEFYERSCEITNKKLVPHLFNKRKWDKLETVYLKTALIYGKLKAMKKSTGGFYNYGTYFLVTFFGKPFDEADGKRFVYRTSGLAHAEAFATELQKKYEAALGEPVELLRKNDLDAAPAPESNTIQVVCVQPAWDEKTDKSKFEQSAYKALFTFEVRWQESEDRSIARTRKKVFSVRTATTLPHRATRLPVEGVTRATLCPIRVAVDDIEARARGLYEVCDCEPFSTSTVESILTGTIMPQVNGGLKMYFDAFYTPEEKAKISAKDIALFEDSIVRLMDACEYAIKMYTEQLVKQKKSAERGKMFNAICDYFEQAEMLVKKQLTTLSN